MTNVDRCKRLNMSHHGAGFALRHNAGALRVERGGFPWSTYTEPGVLLDILSALTEQGGPA